MLLFWMWFGSLNPQYLADPLPKSLPVNLLETVGRREYFQIGLQHLREKRGSWFDQLRFRF
jgi:hypothetical protein